MLNIGLFTIKLFEDIVFSDNFFFLTTLKREGDQ